MSLVFDACLGSKYQIHLSNKRLVWPSEKFTFKSKCWKLTCQKCGASFPPVVVDPSSRCLRRSQTSVNTMLIDLWLLRHVTRVMRGHTGPTKWQRLWQRQVCWGLFGVFHRMRLSHGWKKRWGEEKEAECMQWLYPSSCKVAFGTLLCGGEVIMNHSLVF